MQFHCHCPSWPDLVIKCHTIGRGSFPEAKPMLEHQPTPGSVDVLAGHQACPPEERGPPHCRSYAGRRSLYPRLEETQRSFVNGPSRARRHRGTLAWSFFPVESVKFRSAPIAGAHKMFLKRKSSAVAGFSHFVAAFFGQRGRRRCTDRTWSTPVGLYFSAAGEPTCTTIES